MLSHPVYPDFAELFVSTSLASPAQVIRHFHQQVAVQFSYKGRRQLSFAQLDAGFSDRLDYVCCSLIPSGMPVNGA